MNELNGVSVAADASRQNCKIAYLEPRSALSLRLRRPIWLFFSFCSCGKLNFNSRFRPCHKVSPSRHTQAIFRNYIPLPLSIHSKWQPCCSLSRCSFNFAWSFDVNSKFHKQGSFSSSSRAICSSRRKVPITGNRGISKFLAVVRHSCHFQFVLSYHQASEIQMDLCLLRLPLTLIFSEIINPAGLRRSLELISDHHASCIKVSKPAQCVWQKHGLLILNMCPAREFVCVPSFSLPPSSRRSVLAGSHNSRNRRRRRFCNCFFAWWAGRLVQTADRQT